MARNSWALVWAGAGAVSDRVDSFLPIGAFADGEGVDSAQTIVETALGCLAPRAK